MEPTILDPSTLFYRVFHDSPVGMVITTLAEGRYVEVNDAYAHMLGYTPPELIGQTFPMLGLGHSEERHMVIDVLQRAGKLGDIPLLLRTRNGETRTAIGSVQLEDLGGETYLVSMIQDLTDHERIQSALQNAESRFRIFFQSIPLPLLVYDVATLRFVDVNPVACRQYGYTHDEFLSLTAPDVWVVTGPDELAAVRQRVNDPTQTRLGVDRHRRKDGSLIDVDVVSYAFAMEDRPVRLSIAQDITEQRAVESALRTSEERLRIIADVTTDAMWDRDLTTEEVTWSHGLSSLFGFDLSGNLDHVWWSEHIHPDDRDAVTAGINAVLAGDAHHWADEYRFRCADGHYANVLDRGYVIRDSDGRPLRFIGAMVDITVQMQVAEAAARAAQEERQRLARDLHEAVTQSLYSASLMAEAARRHSSTADLSTTGEYVARLSQLSQQALRQLRLLVYELRPTMLEQEGLVGALRHRLEAVEQRAGIQARLIDEGDGRIPVAVQDELFLIAQEALNNSLKHAAASVVTVIVGATPESVWLEVRDNGCGFDAGNGQVHGLGFNSLREHAARLGGQLAIESAPGGGAVVRVQLALDGDGRHDG
jgi:PAS domain S-box-containing protein